MNAPQPLLQLTGIVKDYPGVRAVDGANLELSPGEVHGLVGENGAGKSTLIRIMAGVVRRDGGEIRLRGQPMEIRSASEAYRLGLSFIHQELNLVPHLNGAENIFLGHPLPKTVFGTVHWRHLRQNAVRILERLECLVRVDVPVVNLSRGDQAMISIGRAFAEEASIYVMDEPTASLTQQEVHNLFRVIQLLKSQGQTVLYVSHRLEEIFEIADRVSVMCNGAVVGTYDIPQINRTELIRLMIGRTLAETAPTPKPAAGEPLLSANNLRGGRVRNVSFNLRAGQILGLAGLVGAGRTDVLRMIFGANPIRFGTLQLKGRSFRPKSPTDAIREGIVLVPEDRHSQGLVLDRSIVENITLPHLAALAIAGVFVNRGRERAVGEEAGRAVLLKARSLTQKVSELSGGNQQKVVFARWLIDHARILLLDEPTSGVDVGARFEIHRIIRELAGRGAGVILVSSDLTELLSLADRLIVMREGQMVAELENAGLSQEAVLSYCYGERS